MGPILFLCYVNDLSNVYPPLSTILYADDTTFLKSDANYGNLVAAMSIEMNKFEVWAAANRLSIDYDKSVVMIYSNRLDRTFPREKLQLGTREMDYVEVTKYLGVRIDNSLKFDNHIEHTSNKISKTIGILYKIKSSLTEKLLIKLYYTLIYPYLIYCNVVWGGTNYNYVNRLLLLQQKEIVRIITNESYLAHSDPLFYRTGILKITELHTFLLAFHSFKEKSLQNLICPDHTYSTRQRDDAIPQFQRLALTQNTIYYAGPAVKNSLPFEIRGAASLPKFKRLVKRWLLSGYE